MTILDQIKELKKKSKKRNFVQKYDLIVNLKELDLKKDENKIDEILVLPKDIGKKPSVVLFSDSVKDIEGCQVIKGSKIEDLSKDKKSLKKLISQTDFFLSEPKLMPIVGKHLGKFLAPINQMPKPVVGDLKKVVSNYKKGIKIQVKKQPIIHTVVGSEDMKEEDITENIKAVVDFIKLKVPKGKNNIDTIYLKLTMSHPIKLKV